MGFASNSHCITGGGGGGGGGGGVGVEPPDFEQPASKNKNAGTKNLNFRSFILSKGVVDELNQRKQSFKSIDGDLL